MGEHNRLEHYGLYEWEYDEEGNVVLRIDETPTGDVGDKVEFEWDHRNRLTKIVMSKDTEAGAGITWTVDRTVTFEYDAFDRRIEKRRINPGQGTPSLDNVSYGPDHKFRNRLQVVKDLGGTTAKVDAAEQFGVV